LRCWIKQFANDRLIALGELRWSHVVFCSRLKLQSFDGKRMIAARRVSGLKVSTKLINVGLHGELHCTLSTIAAYTDTQVVRDRTKIMTLELAEQLSLKLSHLGLCTSDHDEVINVCKDDEASVVYKDAWVRFNWVEANRFEVFCELLVPQSR
jgi:hypothetical protein